MLVLPWQQYIDVILCVYEEYMMKENHGLLVCMWPVVTSYRIVNFWIIKRGS